jgi:hypothetical protein
VPLVEDYGTRDDPAARFETFNMFNHTQWAVSINTGISGANPGAQVTAATRGTSGQVNFRLGDPRNIQIGLKIYF